jgi:Holliday junction resolvase RusA-like endonuclease
MSALKLSTAEARRLGINIQSGEAVSKGQQRPARQERKINRKPRRIKPCLYVKKIVAGGVEYHGHNGSWLKITDSAVIVKIAYPLSANSLWRAVQSKGGDYSTNILSREARAYKGRIAGQLAPLLLAIGWTALNQLCEARLIVQPPARDRTYSNESHPRYDVDNYSKPVLDALKGDGLLFVDDRIFITEHVDFAKPVQGGCVWLSCVRVDNQDWMHKDVNIDWLGGA